MNVGGLLFLHDSCRLISNPLYDQQVDVEKSNPHSVERECGEYILHLWSHSLYVLACLINEVYMGTIF